MILLDDVGFGALGSFGGPIRTPNIDRIAMGGLRYTNFHTTALCSPTRAALLTGRNHHSVGTGVITEIATDHPGYTGRIPKSAALVSHHLRENGYATFAIGKWHNTPGEEVTTQGPHDLWPNSLGFDRFYGFIGGETNNWAPTLWENVWPIGPSKKPDYHLAVDLADHAILYLEKAHRENPSQPFFLYFAPAAGHAPHHVPKEYADRYKGQFDQGWDAIRAQILEKQKSMGIVPANTTLAPRPDSIKAWEKLSDDEKRLYARMQEVFAGFVEQSDEQIGRVIDAIQRMGQADNTIFIITSDNGASGEGSPLGSYNEMRLFNALGENLEVNLKNLDLLGSRDAYNHYPAGWALAMNTPNKYWKQFTNEGGVQDPFIIQWPKHLKDPGSIRNQFTHVIDIVPTLFELLQIQPAKIINGVEQKPIEGVSFAPTLADSNAPTAKKAQYFEMLGNRAIWADGWKAVAWHGRLPWQTGPMKLKPFTEDKWELYRLSDDVSETRDLSAQYPGKLKELQALFDEEARKYNVYPLDDRLAERILASRSRFNKGKFEFVYKGVQKRIPEELAPQSKNRSFKINAKVTVPESGCSGVLVQQGGRFGGFALYCKDGKLRFAHNFVGESVYEVDSNSEVPPGKAELGFEFKKTGVDKGLTKGVGRLFVNGQKVGEAAIPRTVPIYYPETFDVGVGSGTAVSENYQTPFEFTGPIDELKFELGKDHGGTRAAPSLD